MTAPPPDRQAGRVERALTEAASRIAAGTTDQRRSRTKSGIIGEAGVSRAQTYQYPDLLDRLQAQVRADAAGPHLADGSNATSWQERALKAERRNREQRKQWAAERAELTEWNSTLVQQVQALTVERDFHRDRLAEQGTVIRFTSPPAHTARRGAKRKDDGIPDAYTCS